MRSGQELRNTTDKLLSETTEKDRLAKQLTELKNELRTAASKLTIVLEEEGKKFATEIQERIEHVLTTLDSVPEGPFR
jgi:DNA repair ATPase RecN